MCGTDDPKAISGIWENFILPQNEIRMRGGLSLPAIVLQFVRITMGSIDLVTRIPPRKSGYIPEQEGSPDNPDFVSTPPPWRAHCNPQNVPRAPPVLQGGDESRWLTGAECAWSHTSACREVERLKFGSSYTDRHRKASIQGLSEVDPKNDGCPHGRRSLCTGRFTQVPYCWCRSNCRDYVVCLHTWRWDSRNRDERGIPVS